MIGAQRNNRGRSPEVTDEDLLNVIRRSDNKEVPTRDIADNPTITVGYEAVRVRMNELENQNRVSSRSAGKMRMWRLAELETDEPVRKPEMAKAHRLANGLWGLGKSFFYLAFGLLFASIFLFIMYLHALAGEISPPLLSLETVLMAGYVFGYFGASFGVVAGLAFGISAIIPKATAWKLVQRKADDEQGG